MPIMSSWLLCNRLAGSGLSPSFFPLKGIETQHRAAAKVADAVNGPELCWILFTCIISFFFSQAKIYLSTSYVLGTGTTQWIRTSVCWGSAAYWEELAFNNEITQIGIWWWTGPSAVKGKKSCCRGLNQKPDLERAGVKLKVKTGKSYPKRRFSGKLVQWVLSGMAQSAEDLDNIREPEVRAGRTEQAAVAGWQIT